MSLADDLARDLVIATRKCPVHVLSTSFTEEEKKAFDEAVVKIRAVPADLRRNRNYPYTLTWLVGVLRSNGYAISKDSVKKHIDGGCNCESV